MRKAYIHCGPHKTGSSTLQHGLRAGSAELPRYGFLFPDLRLGTETRGVAYKRLREELPTLKRGGRKAVHWQCLSEIMQARNEHLVLSQESIANQLINRRNVQAVVRFFAERDTRVVFVAFVRDQPAIMNSGYVQTCKKFYTAARFEDFVRRAQHNARFDYWRYFANLRGHGAFDFVALPFERSVKAGLITSFSEAIGLDAGWAGQLRVPAVVNANIGAKGVFIGRRFASRLRAYGLNPRNHGSLYACLNKNARRFGWHKQPYVGLDDGLASRIRRFYQPSNDRFARATWGRSWSELFEPASYAKQAFRWSDASTVDRLQVRWVMWHLNRLAKAQLRAA